MKITIQVYQKNLLSMKTINVIVNYCVLRSAKYCNSISFSHPSIWFQLGTIRVAIIL